MPTNPSIFKAYDIRGIYPEDLNEKTAYELGIAYAELRKQEVKNKENKLEIVVASDARISSPSLKKALIRGLMDADVNVMDIGIQATPTFYFAVANYKHDGGIMISASHNPKEWNGFKMVRDKAIPLSGDTGILDLQKMIIENQVSPSKNRGSVTEQKGALEEQIKHDLKHANIDKIKKYKIVADPANAVGSLFLEELFQHLDCEVIKINFELDGEFPNHEADPLKEENLKQIKEAVIQNQADLGITTDGDGDRIFFIDNNGQLIDPSIIRALLSALFLKEKPNSKIGFDVRPGKITEDLIIQNGGQAIKTRVGHSLIKEQMLKEDIYFSGESSGHFFLNMPIGCFEVPNIVIIKLLEFFSQKDEPIANQIKEYQKYYHSGEINRDVKDKAAVIDTIKQKYQDGKIETLDGISVSFADYWFNIRGSNTENKMRLNLEATNHSLMEEKRDELLKLIK